MKNIKQAVKKVKEETEGDKLTNKDLLLYIIKRLDDLDAEYGGTKAKVAQLEGMVGILSILLSGVILKLIYF
jgi:hypothetical protein